MSFDSWFQTFWDVLQSDDVACLQLLRSLGGSDHAVQLVEGEATPADALAYARTLGELGYATESREILWAVIRAELGEGIPAAA